jgi:hypothetical protein
MDRQEAQPAAQVRLFEDQQQSRHHEEPRQDDPLQPAFARRMGIVGGQHQDQDQLRKFGRLEGKRTDRDPPLRAAAGFSRHEHDRQQDQRQPVKHVGQPGDLVVVEDQHGRKGAAADHDPEDLLHIDRQPRLQVGHAVDGQHPDAQDGRHDAEKLPVEAVEGAAVDQAVDHDTFAGAEPSPSSASPGAAVTCGASIPCFT